MTGVEVHYAPKPRTRRVYRVTSVHVKKYTYSHAPEHNKTVYTTKTRHFQTRGRAWSSYQKLVKSQKEWANKKSFMFFLGDYGCPIEVYFDVSQPVFFPSDEYGREHVIDTCQSVL